MNPKDVALQPPEMVARGQAMGRRQFIDAYGDTALLLIRLDGVQTDLALGLAQASTADAERVASTGEPMSYSTVVGSAGEHISSSSRTERRRTFDQYVLQKLLLSAPHFVAPLRKRPIAGKPFSSRISVGRARNNDVVLRHESVSKFHAWFECDEEGRLLMGEARSTNPTLINGKPAGRDVQLVQSGDVIRFGAIETTLCAAETFWDALHDT